MKTCRKGLHQYEGRRCTECARAAVRAWEKRNPERTKTIAAKSRAKRADSISRYRKAYHAERRDEDNAKSRDTYYRLKAEGKIAKSTEKVRAWKRANPQRAYEMGVKENARRLRLKHAALGSHTAAEWKAIVAKQHGRCAECRLATKLEKDHIVPLSRGGSDMAVNLQGLCRSCNARKSNHLAAGTQISVFDRVAA
jgi:5-methylcytosine-specific restriction protein A